jgi:hypothetical protein
MPSLDLIDAIRRIKKWGIVEKINFDLIYIRFFVV